MGYQGPKLRHSIDFEAPPITAPLDFATTSDLGNTMLLLKNRDQNIVPVKGELDKFRQTNPLPQGSVLILHDSFYVKISPYIAKRLHNVRDSEKISDNIADKDFIIVNMAERSFPRHLTNRTMGWESPLGEEILRQNAEKAKSCAWENSDNWFERDNPKFVRYSNLVRLTDGWVEPKNADPTLVFNVSELDKKRGICIELDLETPIDGKFEVFLQSREWPEQGGAWVGGRSIVKSIAKGENKVQIVVPISSDTRYIRVDPIGTKTKFKLNSAKLVSYE
jgi:hypothetical protein